MSEFAAPNINTHMRYTSAGCVEEHEIASFQLALGYGRTDFVLSCRRAWQAQTKFLVDIAGESGAVKTIRCGSTCFIRDTNGWFDCSI